MRGFFAKSTLSEMKKILRFAQDDSERAHNDDGGRREVFAARELGGSVDFPEKVPYAVEERSGS